MCAPADGGGLDAGHGPIGSASVSKTKRASFVDHLRPTLRLHGERGRAKAKARPACLYPSIHNRTKSMWPPPSTTVELLLCHVRSRALAIKTDGLMVTSSPCEPYCAGLWLWWWWSHLLADAFRWTT